jgi:LPS-assembly protein
MVTVPYYWVIAPHRDFTFSPTFTTKEGAVLAGEYRERTHTGEYEFDASVTYPEKRSSSNVKEGGRELRGHLRGTGKFDIDRSWRWGFDAFTASDDTYLSRYGISGADVLENNIYIEGFRKRNYAAANAWAYQDLRRNQESGQTPHVLPLLEYNYVGEPGKYGQRLNFDTSFLTLVRTDGRDVTRVSGNVGWRLPYVGPAGDVYTLNASVRADGYVINDSDGTASTTGQTLEDTFTGRIWPTLSMDWRYPFVRRDGTTRQIVEPIVQGILTPNEGNSSNIPNEDSQSFEFDDTNLFSENRFPGIDRQEDGPRINYGLRAGVYGESGGYSTILLGQTLRARNSGTFDGNTGLEGHLSDFVGRVHIVPAPYLHYSHRFRLDRDTLQIRRNEIDIAAGPKALRFTLGYIKLSDELETDDFTSREELRLTGSAKITPNWSVDAYDRIDLTDDGGTVKYGGALTYRDECIEMSLGFERRFTQDRDVRPSTDFNFRIILRNLG